MRKFKTSLKLQMTNHLSFKGPGAQTHIQDIYFEGCFTRRDFILSTEFYPVPRPDKILIGHLERLFNETDAPPDYIAMAGGVWNVFSKDLDLVWAKHTKSMTKLRKVRWRSVLKATHNTQHFLSSWMELKFIQKQKFSG